MASELVKSQLILWDPSEYPVFLCELVQWSGYCGEVLDKPPVIARKAQKSLFISGGGRVGHASTFWTLLGSVAIPSLDMMWPRYCTSCLKMRR